MVGAGLEVDAGEARRKIHGHDSRGAVLTRLGRQRCIAQGSCPVVGGWDVGGWDVCSGNMIPDGLSRPAYELSVRYWHGAYGLEIRDVITGGVAGVIRERFKQGGGPIRVDRDVLIVGKV